MKKGENTEVIHCTHISYRSQPLHISACKYCIFRLQLNYFFGHVFLFATISNFRRSQPLHTCSLQPPHNFRVQPLFCTFFFATTSKTFACNHCTSCSLQPPHSIASKSCTISLATIELSVFFLLATIENFRFCTIAQWSVRIPKGKKKRSAALWRPTVKILKLPHPAQKI